MSPRLVTMLVFFLTPLKIVLPAAELKLADAFADYYPSNERAIDI